MIDELDAVTMSYHRCRASEGFFDTFYDRFLAKDPEVVAKFRGTDFSRQKLMLRQSLIMMLLYNQNEPAAIDELQRLGKRHSRQQLDIPPHLYDLWLDALCEAVQRHDPEYKSGLCNRWREAMRPGIELIVSMY